MAELPIERALPEIREALARRRMLVLQAPPGAGKTTRVPLALLDEPWLDGGRIVMLEPRRLAARAAARRMASTLGEPVGETVGYRVRSDTRVGPRTRIEVVTEGVLTRMLQSDPALEGVGLVIFDEFHERSVHADLGLALTLQSRSVLREDLAVVLMSATLDGGPVAALLGDAPIVTSEGRAHPVETRYLPARWDGWIEPLAARTVERALDDDEGDVLVFLPGAAEIRRTEERLVEAGIGRRARIASLHGSLPQEAQELAIAPSRPGERKVVLATSIAETSLTIEGVRVVIDSGLMRVPRFSPRTAMARLETVTVSAASAEQRRGRAGRLGPGVCYRLWTEGDQAGLVPHGTPEILDTDLAPLALELAAWGVTDPGELRWLDAPPAAAFAQARELLRELDALDDAGALTAHGRAMAEIAAHPRIAHMMLRARELGHGALACDLAGLLSERDPIRGSGGPPPADVRLRVAALRGRAGPEADRGALARAREESRRWRERLGVGGGSIDEDAAGLLLALAYPDRIAQLRPGGGGRYLLRNGRGAALPAGDPLGALPYLAAVELDDQGRESRVFLAAPLDPAVIEAHFGGQIVREEEVAWDAEAGAVRARRRERLGALVLREAPLPVPDPEAVAGALTGAIRQEGLGILPWTPGAVQTRQRIAFLHAIDPDWPDVSDEALLASLDDWLRPHLAGVRRRDEIQRLDLSAILRGQLSWKRAAEMDALAPTHVDVPSGSRVPIDYSDPAAPVLAVRLQEVFGLRDTPRVAGGRVPLTLHLLSPARRPVQVTRDLASFWSHGYFEVRKDLRGRYPKHSWPDDPLSAEATSRTRRR